MATYRLWLPQFRPTTLNHLMHCHWRKKHRLKMSDQQVVSHYAQQQQIPTASGKRRVSVTVLMGPRMRQVDPDSLHKSLFDALKACGLLVDDSPKLLEPGPVTQVRPAKGEAWGTIVELEEV